MTTQTAKLAAQKQTRERAQAIRAGAAKVRAGWKIGTPKRADGTTGTNDCVCGCGTKVKRLFAQGHDARVHSWLLAVVREEKAKNTLPATVTAALDHGVLVLPTEEGTDGRVLSQEARHEARKQAARKERKQARQSARKAKPSGKRGSKLPLSGLASKAA
jgi:hypothetical protein